MPDATILIALSDPAIGYLLGQSALQPAGFNVIFAKDRHDVEEKFMGETPDLVILSETLNDSDGLTLAEHLLQDHPQVPVLFLPYQHSEALAYRALQVGVTGYLTPPAKAAEVLAAIRKGLERRRKLVEWARQEGELHAETLADYAASAIENARLFTQSEVERKKMETLLTKINEGVMVMDHEQRLLFINPVARHILGIDGRKTIGLKASEVIQQQDLIEVIFEEKRSLPSQAEINLDDGRVFNAQLTPIPEVGLAVTMQDITHLKELDLIKSDFVNSVSHDLRSPLTAILGYIELLDRVGPLNEQQAEFVRRVRLGVNNITTLIDDLLDLGRIEAGFDSRKEIIAFNNVIQYAVESLKRDAIAKSQKLILDIPANLPHIFGNPLRLRQMVTNLISNAIKYTQEGGRICVRAYVKSDQLILEVSDNGMGITAADQPYIFDKFYRGENTLEDIPGTGLGLAIVKSIVNNHQGRIWVESQLWKGSTFTVVLPKTDLDL
jgi:two-component system phosphate regulon sensor histidine kinase PhoR